MQSHPTAFLSLRTISCMRDFRMTSDLTAEERIEWPGQQEENQPEIIVVLKPSAALNAMSGEVPSSLAEFGATLRPVFPVASVPRSDELSGRSLRVRL